MKKIFYGIAFLILVFTLCYAQTSDGTMTETRVKHKTTPAIVSFFKNVFSAGNLKEKKAYEEGYRAGVREQLKKFKENFVDNQVPYYYWQSPVTQKVKVPAQIVNGLFIPAHYEYVIIQPGKWQQEYAYPIAKGESR